VSRSQSGPQHKAIDIPGNRVTAIDSDTRSTMFRSTPRSRCLAARYASSHPTSTSRPFHRILGAVSLSGSASSSANARLLLQPYPSLCTAVSLGRTRRTEPSTTSRLRPQFASQRWHRHGTRRRRAGHGVPSATPRRCITRNVLTTSPIGGAAPRAEQRERLMRRAPDRRMASSDRWTRSHRWPAAVSRAVLC
jgi:hypothetical protein